MAKILQCTIAASDELTDEERVVIEGLLDHVPCPEEHVPRDSFEGLRDSMTVHAAGGTVTGLEYDAQPDRAGLACLVFFCSAGGEEIAVKVPRVGITETLRDSVEDAAWLLRAGRIAPALRHANIEEYLAFNRGPVLGQGDMAQEACNLEAMAATLSSLSWVHIPRLYRSLCTPTALVMERVYGKSLFELNADERDPCARLLVTLQARMWLVDGLYHADPHPGNLLFGRDAAGDHMLTLLDFGIVCRLSPEEKKVFREFMAAFSYSTGTRRCAALAEAFSTQACVPRANSSPVGELRKAMRVTVDAVLGPEGRGTMDAAQCTRIARIAEEHGYEPMGPVFRSVVALGAIQAMVKHLVGADRACELGTIVYLEMFGGELLASLLADGELPLSSSDEDGLDGN